MKTRKFSVDSYTQKYENNTDLLDLVDRKFIEAIITKDTDAVIKMINKKDFDLDKAIEMKYLPLSLQKLLLKVQENTIKNFAFSFKKKSINENDINISRGSILFLCFENGIDIIKGYESNFYPSDFFVTIKKEDKYGQNAIKYSDYSFIKSIILYNNEKIKDFCFFNDSVESNKILSNFRELELLSKYEYLINDSFFKKLNDTNSNMKEFVVSFKNYLEKNEKSITEKSHKQRASFEFFKKAIKDENKETASFIYDCLESISEIGKKSTGLSLLDNSLYNYCVDVSKYKNKDFDFLFNFILKKDKDSHYLELLVEETYNSLTTDKGYQKIKTLFKHNSEYKKFFIEQHKKFSNKTGLNAAKLQLLIDCDLPIDKEQIKEKTVYIKMLMKSRRKKKQNLINFYERLSEYKPEIFSCCVNDKTLEKIKLSTKTVEDEKLFIIFERQLLKSQVENTKKRTMRKAL